MAVIEVALGLDAQDKVHVQAFFPEDTPLEDAIWKVGFVVVGTPPGFGIGLHLGHPTITPAVIEDKDLMKRVVVSVLNEGGFQADTYLGKFESKAKDGMTVIAAPATTGWISLDSQMQKFFMQVNDMLNG